MKDSRTIALLGDDGFKRLRNSRVIVVGLGGVGGIAAELLARSGVGSITVVDGDVFEPTNLNRQIFCTESAIGKSKAEAAKSRLADIRSDVRVTAVNEFVSPDNVDRILSEGYDYCVDAIDDIPNKVRLIIACKAKNIPIVSAMGAGNRTDCMFELTDIYKTKYDPFAKIMRKSLKNAGVEALDCVCAVAPPNIKSPVPASVAAPPTVMGATMAGYVVEQLSR